MVDLLFKIQVFYKVKRLILEKRRQVLYALLDFLGDLHDDLPRLKLDKHYYNVWK